MKNKDTEKNKKKYKKAAETAPINKISFPKPGNFLYPVPAVMVSCQDEAGKPNIITLAWAGTICSDPPMLSISVRKERYSHALIKQSGEFVVNLVTEELAWAVDYCGVKSGRDVDKYHACGLTVGKSEKISAPTIQESPVSIECKVKQVLELGSHDMFIAEVVGVQVDARYLDEKGGFHLEDADLIAYSHGRYFALGEQLGTFGFSVRKKAAKVSEKMENGKKTLKKAADAKKLKHTAKAADAETIKKPKHPAQAEHGRKSGGVKREQKKSGLQKGSDRNKRSN